MNGNNRYVLTIATGKKMYTDMAASLARSFLWWHPDTDIIFRIVTDNKESLPDDVLKWADILSIKPGEFGLGFSTKLHLDKLVDEGQTLFIDSDCLIYGRLDRVFEKFKGHPVSVIGNYIAEGEWFGNVADVCRQFNVRHLPKFNGGIYYLKKGEIATKVYETARSLEKRYDEIGFVRLRNRPNDEVLMALAMELNGQATIADDGSILAEFVNFQSGIKSDLLNGIAELYNDPQKHTYQKNWHLTVGKPVIVHYLGHYNQVMPYIKEVKQLKYIFENKLNPSIARLLTFFRITVFFGTASYFKKNLRPLYHLLFGTRKIKTSERVVG